MIRFVSDGTPDVEPGNLVYVYTGTFSEMTFEVLHIEDDGDTLAECIHFPSGEVYIGFQNEDYVVLNRGMILRTVFDDLTQSNLHIYGIPSDVLPEQAKAQA